MRGGMWVVRGFVVAFSGLYLGGCVSATEFTRVKAANRTLQAEKEAIHQELFDERNVNDNLRTKVASLEHELDTNNELLTNLRSENDLLDEMRQTAQSTLEGIESRQTLSDLSLPKLPPSLDSALKRFADQYPSAVSYDALRGTIKWRGDILFPLGSAEVKASSLATIRSFAEVLESPAAEGFETIVVGHTDDRPISRPETKQQHPTNWYLAAHRAIAVGDELRKDGYSPERIGVMGCGQYRPIADNSTEEGRSQNRRVEIYLVPRGSIIANGVARVTESSKPAKANTTLAAP